MPDATAAPAQIPAPDGATMSGPVHPRLDDRVPGGVRAGLRAAGLVAAKDLRLESRTHDAVGTVGLFALLILVTASFALPTGGPDRAGIAAGTLWMAILFASLLGIGRTQALESEEGCLDALLLAPVAREYLFLGKLAASLLFTVAVEMALVPVLLLLMQVPVGSGLALLLAALGLGTLGLVGSGCLFAVIAVRTRMRQALLPALVMPVAVPLMIASVQATGAALTGATVGANMHWLALLVGFDAMVLLVAVLAFPQLVEE